MPDNDNQWGPLSNEDIDKIFGMDDATPDFSGNTEQGKEGGLCCQYHFLLWLKDAVVGGKVAGLEDEARKRRAVSILNDLAEEALQKGEEEAGQVVAPVAQALKEAGMGGLADVLEKMTQGVVYEGRVNDSDLVIQVLVEGIRLKRGKKSFTLDPKEAVIVAGSIGGWTLKVDSIRELFQKAIAEAHEEAEKNDFRFG